MAAEPIDAHSSVRARLRDATSELHLALERHLDLASPEITVERYRRALRGLYGFFAALEPKLVELALTVRPDFPLRQRADLLAADLRALSEPAETAAAGTFCSDLPPLRGPEDLAGCLYVVEGARLGARVVARSIERHLGLTRGNGCSFFAEGSDDSPRRWSAVLSWIDRVAASGDGDRVVSSAVATFRTLAMWLGA